MNNQIECATPSTLLSAAIFGEKVKQYCEKCGNPATHNEIWGDGYPLHDCFLCEICYNKRKKFEKIFDCLIISTTLIMIAGFSIGGLINTFK